MCVGKFGARRRCQEALVATSGHRTTPGLRHGRSVVLASRVEKPLGALQAMYCRSLLVLNDGRISPTPDLPVSSPISVFFSFCRTGILHGAAVEEMATRGIWNETRKEITLGSGDKSCIFYI
jgi:hypothetical protein